MRVPGAEEEEERRERPAEEEGERRERLAEEEEDVDASSVEAPLASWIEEMDCTRVARCVLELLEVRPV